MPTRARCTSRSRRLLTSGLAAAIALIGAQARAQSPQMLYDETAGTRAGPGTGSVPRSLRAVNGRICFVGHGAGPDTERFGTYLYSVAPDGTDLRRLVRILPPSGSFVSPTIVGSIGNEALVAAGPTESIANSILAIDILTGASRTIIALPPLDSGSGARFIRVLTAPDESRAYLILTSSNDSRLRCFRLNAGGAAATQFFEGSLPGGTSTPSWPAVIGPGNALVFSAPRNTSSNLEPHYSDGTVEGTRFITEVRAGSTGSKPNQMLRLGDRIIFTGGGPSGQAVFVLNEDATTVTELRTFADMGAPSTSFDAFVNAGYVVNGRALLLHNGALIHTDGTAAGTFPITTTNAGAALSSVATSGVVVGDRLVFVAIAAGLGREAMATDGTVAGTIVLSDRPDESTFGAFLPNSPSSGSTASHVYYLLANATTAPAVVRSVLRTDGTPEGTSIEALPTNRLVSTNDLFLNTSHGAYFPGVSGNNTTGDGRFELWRTTGTNAGTDLLVDALPPPPPGGICILGHLGQSLIYTSNERVIITDGSPEGTRPLAGLTSVTPADFSWMLNYAELPGGRALIAGGPSNSTLYVTDGTDAGTSILTPAGGLTIQNPGALVALNGRVYLADRMTGAFYSSDGTPEGTTLLRPAIGRTVTWTTTFAGRIYAETNGSSRRIERINPVTGVTTSVVEGSSVALPTQPLGSTNDRLVLKNLNNLIFSVVETDQFTSHATRGSVVADPNGFVLSRPSGSPQLLRIPVGGDSQPVLELPSFNALVGSDFRRALARLGPPAGGNLVMGLDTAGVGTEPYVVDELAGSASILADINPGPVGTGMERFHSVGDRVFFTVTSAAQGRQLWSTDGTTQGTRPIPPVNPTEIGSLTREHQTQGDRAVLVNGRFLFAADDGIHGEELWFIGRCPADFNSDGMVSPDDLDAFITSYFTPGQDTLGLDINNDGLISPDDLDDFITGYFDQTGC